MKYEIVQGDRAEVRVRLEQASGERAIFTRAPRFAFIIRGIVLEKDGTVVTEPGADLDLCRQLEREGILKAVESPSEEDPVAVDAEPEEAVVPGVETITAEAAVPGVKTITAEAVVPGAETITAEKKEPSGEEKAFGLDAESETGNVEDQSAGYEDMVERIGRVKPVISFPLEEHRAGSICNLVYTIYSRGKLLSKSTGGCFSASEGLVERLKAGSFITAEDAVKAIKDEGGLQGISFGDGRVSFDGFPETESREDIQAWKKLCEAVNRAAIRQHNIHARQSDAPNEKYAFRTWLTRLGMNGPDLKEERLILYRNLSGHTAFRTQEDALKWKARQAVRRQELREAKNLTCKAKSLTW